MTSLRAWVAVLALASAVSASGCDDEGGSGNADAFVGGWTFSSGAIEPMCGAPAANLAPFDLTGAALTITKVDASHVRAMVTTTAITCDVSFLANGSTTATSTAGGTCTVSVSGIAAVAKVTSWTLTLSGTTMLTSSLMGSIDSLVQCTPSGSGTLTRVQ